MLYDGVLGLFAIASLWWGHTETYVSFSKLLKQGLVYHCYLILSVCSGVIVIGVIGVIGRS